MKRSVKFKILYMFTYGAIGVLSPLIGQYLKTIGFNGTQIGTITAVGTGVAVLAATFWGDRYANSRDGRKIVCLLCFAAGLMAICNEQITAFVLFAAGYGIMQFFQGPVNGLTDAMVLEQGEDFASIRLCGAIGYGIAVFVGGKLGEVLGLGNIFYVYALCFFLASLVIMTIKLDSAADRRGKGGMAAEGETAEDDRTESSAQPDLEEKAGYRALLHDKRALQLILCAIFIQGTDVANNTYFSFLFTDGGGSIAGVGTVFLLMVCSEAPFMALAPWLSRKFSQPKMIAAAMLLSTLRFGWYATGPSWQLLMVTFFLQGMVNGILLVEYVKYISDTVNPRLIGIAVSAYYAISSNGGTILCNFFGGVAVDHFGSRGVYGLFAILDAVGLLLYVFFGLHREEEKR